MPVDVARPVGRLPLSLSRFLARNLALLQFRLQRNFTIGA